MRLFIAINFKKGVKCKIQEIIRDIKCSSIEGKFVRNEHLHLTLEFFGNISEDRISDIINVMRKVSTRGFLLKPNKLSCFSKNSGDIYYIGFKESDRLLNIQDNIHIMLLEKEFELENRAYTPHITIGRKVVLNENADIDKYIKPLGKIRIKVDSIELMKSEHIEGKLIYTVIYSKKL